MITWTNTVAACQSYKRKIGDVQVNDNHDTAKGLENHGVYRNFAPVVKRICREKTGTEWQTVLNVIQYGEEREKSRLAGEQMTEARRES
jgi:hypothetical protein